MLCVACFCHPVSLLLISLGTSPRYRPECQVGLANIRCEDWFVCKLGKDHQFPICTSVLQALCSDFASVCFEKENVLEEKPKDLFQSQPCHLPLLHMLDAVVSLCSRSNRKNQFNDIIRPYLYACTHTHRKGKLASPTLQEDPCEKSILYMSFKITSRF